MVDRRQRTAGPVSPRASCRWPGRRGSAGGSVRFEQEDPNRLWLGARGESSVLSRGAGQNGAEAQRLSVVPPGHPMGYPDAFAAFVGDSYAAIGGSVPDGLPTFDDGLRAAVLTDAVIRSAGSGDWVDTAEA